MRLILVRHEERDMDIGFFSELTEKGIINSLDIPNKITSIIKKENKKVDAIYCSPFIRTLQTSYCCSEEFRKKINVEYGLYEYIHNPYFLLFNWYYEKDDIKDKDLLSIINNKYKSVVGKDDFTVLENEDTLGKRIIKFFDYIKDKYINNMDENTSENTKEKTIIMITHKGVINKIKDLYVKKTDMDDEFPMGHIEIYNIL